MHVVFSSHRSQEKGFLLVGQKRWNVRVLNGDGGEQNENKYKVQSAVGGVMANIFCYSGGTLLVEFRAMCAGVTEVTTKFGQTAISVNSHHHLFRTALVLIKTLLFILHTVQHTICTL
jgi:hypothetical protein